MNKTNKKERSWLIPALLAIVLFPMCSFFIALFLFAVFNLEKNELSGLFKMNKKK